MPGMPELQATRTTTVSFSATYDSDALEELVRGHFRRSVGLPQHERIELDWDERVPSVTARCTATAKSEEVEL